MTAIDTSTFVFDGPTGHLISRSWPSHEAWTYAYDVNGRLSTVSDGYGRSLQFSYISQTGQYDDGQLWRVGDQTASGLNTGSPTGRYVEFTYTSEKK